MKVSISYDCEGNWGWPEGSDAFFGPDRALELEDAYDQILTVHERLGVPAVFAFVSAYAMSPDDRHSHFKIAIEQGLLEDRFLKRTGGCWDGESNFKRACSSPIVEIASHSATHRIFNTLSDEEQTWELNVSKEILSLGAAKTVNQFVYPRNVIENSEEACRTYERYRDTSRGGALRRAHDLFRGVTGIGLEQSPVSDFVYWRGGVRGRFNDKRWRAMWRRRIQADSSKQYHVYAHPHNLITDLSFLDRLSWLLQLLADANNVQFTNFSGNPVQRWKQMS